MQTTAISTAGGSSMGYTSKTISCLTVAAIAEVTASVLNRISGNDLGTSFEGETLTRQAIQNMAMTEINKQLKG